MHVIKPVALTKSAFSPFGEVVEMAGVPSATINQGSAARFDDLARVDVAAGGGGVNVSLFSANARPTPVLIRLMERHPLGSQMFFPLQNERWLVVVCSDPRSFRSYQAFLADGRLGVNYYRGVWHHPLIALAGTQRFLVIDRKGPGQNLEEVWLDEQSVLSVDVSV